jgi:hypothetical protein
MSMDNPFFHRGALRQEQDFFGRDSEVRQTMGLLRNGQSVSLIGPRRIGKSSMLLQLARSGVRRLYDLDAPEALFVVVDCQELGASPAEEVYESLLLALLDAASNGGVQAPQIQHTGSYRALDRLLSHFARQEVSVILLMDEFELLAANEHLTPHFFARLRGLTTKYGLAYLTASQRPLFDITADEQILSSPFFNIFVTLPLGLFSEKEARGLLAERLDRVHATFSPELTDHILQLVGPHPFFLHVAGYHAFQKHGDQPATDDWSSVDEPVEVEADSHLGYLWQNLSAEEQHALAIAEGPVDCMRLLEQQCLLLPTAHGHQYASEILRRFVRRQQVPGLIQAGPFIIDELRHQVWAMGDAFGLTTSQFALLVCLCQQSGQVVSSDELERVVWGEALVDDPDRLKTMIKRLRRAIEPYGNWVVSERGVGYALREPD